MATANAQQEVAVRKLLVSKRCAASALSLSIRTIENLIARKELTVRRVGRRTLVLASSLEAFTRRDHASPSPARVRQ
jgi:excisionase family DNA binding protein